jgi:hypothetical protein
VGSTSASLLRWSKIVPTSTGSQRTSWRWRLIELRRENTDEAADVIADYEDLRERIEAFLNRAAEFAAQKADQSSIVTATTSFVQGVNNWWSKHHVTICSQAYDRTFTFVDTVIFGIGVDISLHAGASGALAIAIPGAIAGGNRVVQVVKAVMGGGKDKAD